MGKKGKVKKQLKAVKRGVPLALPKGWKATQDGIANEHCAFRMHGRDLVEVVLVVAGPRQELRLRYNMPVEVDALRYLLANYVDGGKDAE